MSVLYNISTVISLIAIDKINNQLHPILSLLISTCLAVLFFNLVNIGNLKKLYKIAHSELHLTVFINFIIAALWIASFYSLYYIDPFSYIFIFSSVPAIISTLVDKRNIFACTMLFSSLVLYLAVILTYVTHSSLGILCALFAGFSSYAYRKINYFYAEKHNISASMCLAIRSYGIILLCTLVILYVNFFHPSIAIIYGKPSHILISILLVSIFSFILPLFVNQKALQKSGVYAHNLITSLIPFMVILVSYLMGIDGGNLVKFKIFISLLFSLLVILTFNSYKLRCFKNEKYTQKIYPKNKIFQKS
jgi:hypothetical protein